ncbi:MAG TPA: hypothetical protein VEC93_14105 [Anaerolineae bacterium]|nr:hypothetical protein [Anaerolineae bacterium]
MHALFSAVSGQRSAVIACCVRLPASISPACDRLCPLSTGRVVTAPQPARLRTGRKQ